MKRTPPQDAIQFGMYLNELERSPKLQEKHKKAGKKNKQWIPFLDAWKGLEHDHKKIQVFNALEYESKRKLMEQRYFIDYYKKLNKDLEVLGMIGKYLAGERMNGSLKEWK